MGSFHPRRFTESEAALLQLAFDRVALAMEHARLYGQALQANRAREEIMGVVAHDLRSPRGAVVLTAEAILRSVAEEPTPGRVGKLADSILRSATRIDRLIQDLLDLAGLDAG